MIPEVILITLSILCTAEAQFVIDRGDLDVFRNLSSCSTDTKDYCYQFHAESSPIDHCICRCMSSYPLYRNPDLKSAPGGTYESKATPGCVWHSYHRGVCIHIRKYKSSDQSGAVALQFNFVKPGNVTAYTDYDMEGCNVLETFIKLPEDSDFKPANISLSATRLTANSIRIQWEKAYKKYNGAIIRGILRNCAADMKEKDRCFVSKISGVYNDNCTVRAVTGECCIFPFTYKGKIYNSCTSVDSVEPWCAVRLRFQNETNWRANCPDLRRNTTAPSPVPSISQTPSLSGATLTSTTDSIVVFGGVSHTLSLSDIIPTLSKSQWSTSISSTKVPFTVSESTRLRTTDSSVKQLFSLSDNSTSVDTITSTPLSSVKIHSTPLLSGATLTNTTDSIVVFGGVSHTLSLSDIIPTLSKSQWSTSISSTKVPFTVSKSTRLRTTDSPVEQWFSLSNNSTSIETVSSTPLSSVKIHSTPLLSGATLTNTTDSIVVFGAVSHTLSLSDITSTLSKSQWSTSISSTKVPLIVSESTRLRTTDASIEQLFSLTDSSTSVENKTSTPLSSVRIHSTPLLSGATLTNTTDSIVVFGGVSHTLSLSDIIPTLSKSQWSTSISSTKVPFIVSESTQLRTTDASIEQLFSLTDNSTSVENKTSTPFSSVKIHSTPISYAKSREIPTRTSSLIDVYQAMNSTSEPKPSSTEQTLPRSTMILPRTTPSQEKDDLEDRLVVVFSIAASVFLVMLLIILIVCVCLCHRRQKAKKDLHSAVELIGSSTSPSKAYTAKETPEERYVLNVGNDADKTAETTFTAPEEHPKRMDTNPTLLTFKL